MGLKQVEGEFVVFAASDDMMRPEKISREVGHPPPARLRCGGAYGDMQLVNADGSPYASDLLFPRAWNMYHSILAGYGQPHSMWNV